MPIPHLSQELIDSIIAQLRGDVQTLRKCTLVCQSFLPTAQRLLFAAVELDSSTEGTNVCTKLQTSLSLNPRLQRYIESLSFRLFWHAGNHIQVLAGALTMFPNLRSLIIRSFGTENQWIALDSSLRYALLNILNQAELVSVSVTGVQGFPLSVFMRCHQLRHISIEGVVAHSNNSHVHHFLPVSSDPNTGWLESLSGGEWESGAGSTRALVDVLTNPHSSLRLSRLRSFAAAL
ncbi:hypothetical protein Hypma_005114 [Hypsizygus marmoreus]|uniref:F-box domain-containing protein n=1 Tax=Hypsizygus marmoreus TaxID=39966 RepID=A0A369JXG4_HYPMA|nr:hypothetical protein Hypma_005114 [Hypsizygus marmoreus]